MKWVYLAAIPFSSGSWPVFQVHARIGNSDLHLHPGFSVLLCVSETMVLFGELKEPFDGLFPLLIQPLHPKVVYIGDAQLGEFPSWRMDFRRLEALEQQIREMDVRTVIDGHWKPYSKRAFLAEL